MKKFCYILLLFCFISTMLLALILYKNNSSTIIRIEDRMGKISNISGGIGVLFGIVSLAIAAIALVYSIQESEIKIQFLTSHYDLWEKEFGKGNLILCEDNDGNIRYQISMPETWNIKLHNIGNKRAENIKVNISFSGIGFYKEPQNYQLTNHIHALGAFATLKWEYKGLNPEEDIILPSIPFECAIDMNSITNKDEFKKLENTEMKIVIWVDNVEKIEKKYTIDFVKYHLGEDKCFNEPSNGYFTYEERVRNIEDEFIKIQKNLDDKIIYGTNNIYNKFNITSPYELIIDNVKKDDYELVYIYYLNNLNIYNEKLQNEMKEKALFWGRINYICKLNCLVEEGKQDCNFMDIEKKIDNDIKAKVVKE